MASVQALVPAEHASDHVLVVPASSAVPEVPELAAAWFDDVGWLVPPRAAPVVPAVGARFRGVRPAPAPAAGPGVLRLGDEHRAVGPYPLAPDVARVVGLGGPAEAWALGRVDGMLDERGARPVSYDDRDGLGRTFAGALPVGEELRVVRWGVAVARRAGGVVLADGRGALRPDPDGGVDLVVWSGRALGPDDLLAAVRSLVATARPADPPRGASHAVAAATPYDGDVLADVVRVDRPPRAAGAPAGSPAVAHRLRWLPQDPYELQVEHPSGLHLIARARVRALLARLALVLGRRAQGEVVDDDGFVLSPADLELRATAGAPGARAWV